MGVRNSSLQPNSVPAFGNELQNQIEMSRRYDDYPPPPPRDRPPYPNDYRPPPPMDRRPPYPNDYRPPPPGPPPYDRGPPPDIYSRPKKSSRFSFTRKRSPETEARRERERYYRERDKEMERREKERAKREKEERRRASSAGRYPWSRRSPSPPYPPRDPYPYPPPPPPPPPPNNYPPNTGYPPPPLPNQPNTPYPPPNNNSLYPPPTNNTNPYPPLTTGSPNSSAQVHEHHHYLHTGPPPKAPENPQKSDKIIDASKCKLVLMCDDEPIAKLAIAKASKPRRRRVHMAPEDCIHPSILKHHMRPISDILKAQHYAASNAADLTNSCITITTVCKEVVC